MNEKQEAILQALASIPAGYVCSYGNLAKRAGLPGHSRYVGYVLKNLPNSSNLPWHRIINSQGKISFPAGSAQHTEQKQRLEREGIVFTGKSLLKDYSIDLRQ